MGMLKTAAFISLPVLGICATVLYLLLKKEEDDLHETLEDVKTSRMKIIEMKIPKATVGVVIGRGGSNIKEIQQETDTRIHFKDHEDDEEYRTCYIKGTAECVQMAESMLHEFITTQPLIEVHEIWVPQKAIGRIIGRNGENIRSISRASNAKLTVDSISSNKNEGSSKTRVVIKGTTEMIKVALSLVQEKVEEDAEVRRKMELCQASRSPRNKLKTGVTASLTNSPEKEKKGQVSESLIPTGSNKMMNVFVSAVDSPFCFWVQVYGPRSGELDHLLEEMTEYYSVEENRILHEIKQPEIGQIVAAPFSHDSKWYRAEIKTIEVNDCNENESQVDLYYVDYGDSDYRKKGEICQLRTDFLKLRFQAIECTLANLKPSDGDQWSEKATDLFEELCHVAQWKPLLAKVVSCDQQPRGRREGSPVPSVSLFDSSGAEDIDIGEELVRQGFAVREEICGGSPMRSQSRTSAASGTSTPFLRSATSPEPSSDADSNA
uniref:Tudor domain-containing protein n=1 Tax=Graphocephala atropunctata TaxID=36148 RepID=A0A1B6LIZ4_9HEMI